MFKAIKEFFMGKPAPQPEATPREEVAPYKVEPPAVAETAPVVAAAPVVETAPAATAAPAKKPRANVAAKKLLRPNSQQPKSLQHHVCPEPQRPKQTSPQIGREPSSCLYFRIECRSWN